MKSEQKDDPNLLLTVHLQEEVRKLHFQLHHKDQIIKEIKKASELDTEASEKLN